ncbi:MAG: lipocalin family protein [Deltaproteobacteria bacterium]|nr:lipocalin family protein [Deltaproteobacteria bacterium]
MTSISKRLFFASVAATAMLALATTASAGGPKIIGSWKMVSMESQGKVQPLPPNAAAIWTLKKNGTMTMSAKNGAKTRTENGKWQVKGGKLHTDVTRKIMGKTQRKKEVLSFKITGKNLELEVRPGMKINFVRK